MHLCNVDEFLVAQGRAFGVGELEGFSHAMVSQDGLVSGVDRMCIEVIAWEDEYEHCVVNGAKAKLLFENCTRLKVMYM